MTITINDRDIITKTSEHRGRKTRTDPKYGYFIGGVRLAAFEPLNKTDNSGTWQRFVGCISDLSIQNLLVDFAVSKPQGNYADYSACPVPDPDETTTAGVSISTAGKLLF